MSHVKDARREGTLKYERHKPEQTLLYQIIEKYYPQFLNHMGQQDKGLPKYVRSEFEEYLKCGRLEYGFLRVRCEDCHYEHLVAFSCKRRGFCPSCGARRMAESAALLVDDVLPHEPIRQWGLCIAHLPPISLKKQATTNRRHKRVRSHWSNDLAQRWT